MGRSGLCGGTTFGGGGGASKSALIIGSCVGGSKGGGVPDGGGPCGEGVSAAERAGAVGAAEFRGEGAAICGDW